MASPSRFSSNPSCLWRIADKRHAIMDGSGASLYGGRWNSPGTSVIYTSTSYSLAMLEKLVHLSRASIPKSQVWIKITFPNTLEMETICPEEVALWGENNLAACRNFGDKWVQEKRTLFLLVPSVIAGPNDYNALINPTHPDYTQLEITDPGTVIWDDRLFQL